MPGTLACSSTTSTRFRDVVAFLARDAVAAGMGIRNGVTEVFNFHLGEAPAYGSHIADDGHLHTDSRSRRVPQVAYGLGDTVLDRHEVWRAVDGVRRR